MPDEPLSAYVRRTGCDEMSKDAIADRIAELESDIARAEGERDLALKALGIESYEEARERVHRQLAR